MKSAHAGDKLFVLHDGLACRLRGGNKVALVVPDIDDLHSRGLHGSTGQLTETQI